MDDVRSLAYRLLLQMEKRAAHPDRLLRVALGRSPSLEPRDRALLTELVYGVLRWRQRLDWHLEVLTAGKRLDSDVRVLLRLGLYQIFFLERVPAHAAVHATVEVAKVAHGQRTVGFVNAVLRQALRIGDEWPWPNPKDDAVLWLSVMTSHPVWYAEYALKRWGFDEARAVLSANNEPAGTTCRVNVLKADRDQVIQWFRERNMSAEPSSLVPQAVRLGPIRMDVARCEPYEHGWIQVQDEASQLVAMVVDPQPQDRVLDLCAGFGGKTTHLGILMKNQGEIVAVERDAWKLEELQENARRQGLGCVRTVEADVMELNPDATGLFDRVLVDAPCTGFGVLRRNPDIKWRRGARSAYRASLTQKAFLRQAARFVRRGGILVYATCTVFELENQGVADDFSQSFTTWNRESAAEVLPETCRGVADGPYVVTWPHRHGTDGFFIARWRRLS
ncbi:16S rRNA (cytosine(967)-C(5))-methyltransferase RsmB [Desulfosoma caldarium]|uniref:16S rRNA (cytosine(967)-C(5))-methyltransferase n=1 Tax=Desulfosoma caldarium TaxID=610254 RepID=A0A3N1USA3_9BACT|nr:16S rRNA (cytosine(967)-C(5))-methyltransferase RsmB [Desulfosoma caldarium]ROQ90721.1 16S rRNA (cytosine967-C5)-methyltransferase [Desulfosoma caldarium]